MKRIFILLIFASLGATAQIKVGVQFDKNNPNDNSYNVKSDNVKGSWHSVATILQRDSLLAQYSSVLQDGMAVFVRADSSGYIRNSAAGKWNKFNLMSNAKRDSLLNLYGKLSGNNTWTGITDFNATVQFNSNSRYDGTILLKNAGSYSAYAGYSQIGSSSTHQFVFTPDGYSNNAALDFNSITASRHYIFPDKSDTVAMKSDLSSAGITALTGDVTASGTGSVVATIANSAVSNAKILNSTIDLTTKVNGLLPVANGGTGTATPGIVAGTNVTVTGTWPNQTVNSTAGSGTYFKEVPTGSINSSNTTFTLSHTPVANTVSVFRNGLMQVPSVDYTITGTTITYLYAPTPGDTIYITEAY